MFAIAWEYSRWRSLTLVMTPGAIHVDVYSSACSHKIDRFKLYICGVLPARRITTVNIIGAVDYKVIGLVTFGSIAECIKVTTSSTA